MRAKFSVIEHTQVLHLQAKFHLNVEGGRGNKEVREGEVEHLHAKFHLNVFIVSASGGQIPQSILGKI